MECHDPGLQFQTTHVPSPRSEQNHPRQEQQQLPTSCSSHLAVSLSACQNLLHCHLDWCSESTSDDPRDGLHHTCSLGKDFSKIHDVQSSESVLNTMDSVSSLNGQPARSAVSCTCRARGFATRSSVSCDHSSNVSCRSTRRMGSCCPTPDALLAPHAAAHDCHPTGGLLPHGTTNGSCRPSAWAPAAPAQRLCAADLRSGS